MRKTIGVVVLLISIIVYSVSSSDELTKSFTIFKIKSTSIFKSGRLAYGDLYRMSSLPAFNAPIHQDSVRYIACNAPKKIDLYAVCDSYIWLFLASSKYYCGVNKFSFANITFRESLNVKLDSSKINVLFLEFTERNVRIILEDTAYVERLLKLPPVPSSGPKIFKDTNMYHSEHFLNSVDRIFSNVLFNKEINTNIQSNVWDLSILSSVQEAKASINYRLFGMVHKDVSMATGGTHLFYTPTIDTNAYYTSSFNKVSNAQLSYLIGSLNSIYSDARAIGFDQVYLSIIPNPVSIIEPNYSGLQYNNLVNRIQKSPSLRMQCIDVVPVFGKLKNKVYYPSDTHWNSMGAEIWRDMFNAELGKLIKQSKLFTKK